LYSFESMMHSRYQMFKAVYFHKTVRSAEVMLLESIRLADDELGFTSLSLDEYIQLTDEVVLSKLLSLKSSKPELKRARQFAQDYQNRRLLKCVFETILTTKSNLAKIKPKQIKAELVKKSKVDENKIFVDSSVTPSIPLSPSKKESQSIILVTKNAKKTSAKEIAISEIPVVSAMAGYMNIIRIYTTSKNRNKVEIAAKSILSRIR